MFNNKLKLHKTGQGTENGAETGDREEKRGERGQQRALRLYRVKVPAEFYNVDVDDVELLGKWRNPRFN